MEVIIYDTNKYYRESRWAAELREGGGERWWGISYVRPRWDLYPHSLKCPILRSFRQADLSTPYPPWKILSTLSSWSGYRMASKTSQFYSSKLYQETLSSYKFPSKAYFWCSWLDRHLITIAGFETTVFLLNCIRRRFLLKGFLFYSSKLYQETLSS